MRTTTIKIALPERRDFVRAIKAIRRIAAFPATRRSLASSISFVAKTIEPKPTKPTLDGLKQPASRRMSVGEHLHLQESLSTLRTISNDFDEPAEMVGRPRTENAE